MLLFGLPKTLGEAFGLSMFLLRVSGLFPFKYNATSATFHISWRLLLYTLFHISVYAYVNITLLLDDWEDYVQPLLGHSLVTAFSTLLLRLMGVFNTFFILGPVILGSKSFASSLNAYMTLMDHYLALGIDIVAIYRRIHVLGPILTLIMAGVVGFSSWHSVFFYEKITHQEPTLKYYVVVVLSDYYKSMFLFCVWMQLLTLYLISDQLNKYLMVIVRKHKQRFEHERLEKFRSFKGACVNISPLKK